MQFFLNIHREGPFARSGPHLLSAAIRPKSTAPPRRWPAGPGTRWGWRPDLSVAQATQQPSNMPVPRVVVDVGEDVGVGHRKIDWRRVAVQVHLHSTTGRYQQALALAGVPQCGHAPRVRFPGWAATRRQSRRGDLGPARERRARPRSCRTESALGEAEGLSVSERADGPTRAIQVVAGAADVLLLLVLVDAVDPQPVGAPLTTERRAQAVALAGARCSVPARVPIRDRNRADALAPRRGGSGPGARTQWHAYRPDRRVCSSRIRPLVLGRQLATTDMVPRMKA